MNALVKRIHTHMPAQTDKHIHTYIIPVTQKTITVDNLKNKLKTRRKNNKCAQMYKLSEAIYYYINECTGKKNT